MPFNLINPRGFTPLKFTSNLNTFNSSPEVEVSYSDLPSTNSTSSTYTFLPPLCDAEVELVSVDQLAAILNAEWPSLPDIALSKASQKSEKTDVLNERKRKLILEEEALIQASDASKIPRTGEKTDVPTERGRCATLTKTHAVQAQALGADQLVQAEKTENAMKFDAETVTLLRRDSKCEELLDTLFTTAVEKGYEGAKSLDDYVLEILKQCAATYKSAVCTVDKNELFYEVDKEAKIFSFKLQHPLFYLPINKKGNEIWIRLDKQNRVVALYRPSTVNVAAFHRQKTRKMASAHKPTQRQLKIERMA